MKPEIVLGVTGTRNEPTREQRNSIRDIIDRYSFRSKMHHGCCVGVDAYITVLCRLRSWTIVAHPPINRAYFSSISYNSSDIKLQDEEYLVRNQIIVIDTNMLLAVPETEEEVVRSGTWSTVRFARTLAHPILIVWPSGRIEIDGEG